ncbi:hypothetical protein [Methylobacterium oryzihabitans]|uniref:Glycosyl transferase family 2 n=1 Tax=Methylobacterium oryzihabitans TaxID=2499852 RepID=A0A3S2VFN3_9HYPH|nr:hypothetical protein [Methylobacterium oryzihabitans]RVU21876.1 hypothetical protein EOE48_02180 [Methylobacterium oryzihabitans]
MFTAVVHVAGAGSPSTVDALADTLSALVDGVAAGVIGDAVIATAHARDPDYVTIAESTGAILVACGATPWTAAAAVARRAWLLCLDAGDVPAEGWVRTLDRFAATAGPQIVLARLARPGATVLERLAARREALAGTRTVRAGDVVRRDAVRAGLPLKRVKAWPLRASVTRG